MRNFKFFTMIFAIMATLCFTACENDNDKKQEMNTCEPAACEMVENATEMGCDDTDCQDGDKDKCTKEPTQPTPVK